MKERLGWICAVLAALALLTGVRIPARQEAVIYTAGSQPAPVEAIPVHRGDIPVNTADAAALATLPGIGEVLSQAIIDEREARGLFFYPEDLLMVRGIGEKTLAEIYALVDLQYQVEGLDLSGDTGG